jgi:hypothetical protein
MVWLEKGDGPTLSAPTDLWNMIRDGYPLSNLSRPRVGFQVIQHFISPKGIRFLPGMQGQVIKREGNGVYVQVVDLFDADGNFLKAWISEKVVDIGTKLYGTWKIDVCNIPRAPSHLTAAELSLLNDPNSKHLALSISTFLKKLVQTKPECLTDDNFQRLGGATGSKIPYITTIVIKGIQKAGLISVLSNRQFTIQGLETAASLDCTDRAARGESGFYFRRYIEPNTDPETDRSKKACSFYIGQSHDLNARHHGWLQSGHEELVQRSDHIAMRALCRVDTAFYQDHKYIVEQIFTSLFQTYKPTLLNRNVDLNDDSATFHQKNCADMDKIATAAANESGWTGALQRESFWKTSYASCTGLNVQTPMAEAPTHDPSVWLRTDGWMPDIDDPTKSIPVSNFRRDKPKKMTVLSASGSAASQDDYFLIFALQSEINKDYRMRVTKTLSGGLSADGVEWPAAGSFFTVNFEVRTDWKPHPYSWARLPLVGPFEDWDRANSWAMSINWVDLSGKNRTKYVHCERPLMLMNEQSCGSVQPYARGIEVRDPMYLASLDNYTDFSVDHPLAVQREDPGQSTASLASDSPYGCGQSGQTRLCRTKDHIRGWPRSHQDCAITQQPQA